MAIGRGGGSSRGGRGGGSRGGGRARGNWGRGAGRGLSRHGAGDSYASLGAGDAMSEETDSFFSDLTGARRAPRKQSCDAPAARSGVSAYDEDPLLSAADVPGESIVMRRNIAGSEQTQDAVMWLELGLCKALVRAVSHLGFISPTPVQAEAIPAVLGGTDVCARAVTGSGKTAAFLLPLAHMLLTRPPQKAAMLHSKRRFIRAVVLLPTRELGVQCQSMLQQLLQFTTGLTVGLAIGGVAPSAQEAMLDAAPDVLIATPGRLVDFVHNFKKGAGLDLTGVEVLVLDECDKMLTTVLRDQVLDVLNHVPVETRQVLMFSATMTEEVDEFAVEHLYKPTNVDIGHVALQSKLRQQFVRIRTSAGAPDAAEEPQGEEEGGEKEKRIRSKRLREAARQEKVLSGAGQEQGGEQEHITKIKSRYVVALCQAYFNTKTMIFCRYRTTTHRLAVLFNVLGLAAAEVQGNQTQEERFSAMQKFASNEVHYLITTDVASRGLDIKDVTTVINFDLPPTLTAYIHRVGRTARIGEVGTAVSLVHEVEDSDIMRKILAVSGAINEHQVASVKRRDVPPEQLKKATADIDGVFQQVRAQLAAEQLEQKIAEAEKRYGKSDTFLDTIIAKPKKEWILSRQESRKRAQEERENFEKEAEVTINRFQNELSNLEREEMDILHRQKKTRRVERERKAQEAEKVKAKAKEQRKKSEKKIQAGLVKKLKKKKVRESIRDRRAAQREEKGRTPFKHGDGKVSNKKSRHRKRVKKH